MEKKIFKVLVVDDEDDVRNVLVKVLTRKLNVEVSVTDNGTAAVDITRTLKPDIILLDIHLPGIMGWDVLREIRKFDQAVKVVMATGVFIVPPEDAEFMLQETSGYMTKPVSVEDFCAKVIEVLGDEVIRR